MPLLIAPNESDASLRAVATSLSAPALTEEKLSRFLSALSSSDIAFPRMVLSSGRSSVIPDICAITSVRIRLNLFTSPVRSLPKSVVPLMILFNESVARSIFVRIVSSLFEMPGIFASEELSAPSTSAPSLSSSDLRAASRSSDNS